MTPTFTGFLALFLLVATLLLGFIFVAAALCALFKDSKPAPSAAETQKDKTL